MIIEIGHLKNGKVFRATNDNDRPLENDDLIDIGEGVLVADQRVQAVAVHVPNLGKKSMMD